MDVLDFVIRTMGPKKSFSDEKKFNKILEKRKKMSEYKIPKLKYKSTIIKKEFNGCDVYHFSNNSDKVAIYLHGGAYVGEASIFHPIFVDEIAYESGIDIYFPIYPLAPNYTYKDAYELLFNLYDSLMDKEIILMGDSAGGGLALSFSLYLKELNLKLPYKLILISPWVDISMCNEELKKYEDNDPMLSIYGLVESGKLWAFELDVKDYKVSPLYGDLSGLPETILFTGSKELVYPDICLFYDKLKENGVSCKLIIGDNMGHIYPLYPIKECKEAKNIIVKELIG